MVIKVQEKLKRACKSESRTQSNGQSNGWSARLEALLFVANEHKCKKPREVKARTKRFRTQTETVADYVVEGQKTGETFAQIFP